MRPPCPRAGANSTQPWRTPGAFRSSGTNPPFRFGPSRLLWGFSPPPALTFSLLNNLPSVEACWVRRKERSNIDKRGGRAPGQHVAPSIPARSRFLHHSLWDELCRQYSFETITARKSKIRNYCADWVGLCPPPLPPPLLSDPRKTTSCNVPIVTGEIEEKQMKDLSLVGAVLFCS